jgi:type I restriction enzyme, S subunit
MPTEWRERRLGDLVEAGALLISDGYRVRNDELGPHGIPFVRGGDIGDGWINTATIDHIRPELAGRVRAKLTWPGDLAFITKGTVGRAGLLRDGQPHVVFAPQVAYWRVLDPAVLDSRFLFYLMRSQSFQNALDAVKTHGSMVADYVSISLQHEFVFKIPDIQSQRSIGNILGLLDDKIELNRRMNETLEAMARALFNSWFVDFDPVRAKVEGRDSGLPQLIADLFPARLVDSELDEIPEGWRVSDLRSVTAYLNRGISPAYLENGGVLVLNQKCVREGWVDPSKVRRHNPEARSVDGRLLKKGDILVNSTGVGTLGRVAQVLSLPEDTIVDSHVTVVRADEGTVSWNYLGIWLRDREQEIEALGEGSTGQTELSRSRLGELSILVPPLQMMLAFDEASLPIRERSTASEKESQVLVAIRDALLPKLISGELRLKDAEQVVADAAQ